MRKAIPKIQTEDDDLNRVQDQILAALNPLLREASAGRSYVTASAETEVVGSRALVAGEGVAIDTGTAGEIGVGLVAATAWTPLPWGENWSEHGDASYHDGAYRLGPGGFNVELRGLAKIADTGGSLVIATLPAGFRPSNGLVFVVADNGSARWVAVAADGTLTLNSSAGMSNGWWVSLAAIRFEAAQ